MYGDQQVDRVLVGFSRAGRDLRPAWDQIGDALAEATQRQFSSEGAYGSGGWQRLSPAYGEWKARAYPGKTILRRDDNLYDAVTRRPFGVEVLEPAFAVFGARVLSEDGFDYGAAHQAGAGNLPQRKVFDLPESLRRHFAKILQRYMIENGGRG